MARGQNLVCPVNFQPVTDTTTKCNGILCDFETDNSEDIDDCCTPYSCSILSVTGFNLAEVTKFNGDYDWVEGNILV